MKQKTTNKQWKHFAKFVLILLVIKLVLFILGSFIENGTLGMGLITLAYFVGFSTISILMIKSYKRKTKLNFIEKLLAVTILFLIYVIFGNLLNFIYFTLILGQDPSANEVINKTLEIIRYDSYLLFLTMIIVVFVNSKVTNENNVR